MNICICDDEKIYCDKLNQEIEKYFNNKIINVNIYIFNSLNEFLISNIRFDFIFMDIELTDGNGMDIITERELYKESYIFYFTSHEEAAIKGYKSNAFRFLTKPLNYEDFLEALDSALNDYYILKTIIVSVCSEKIALKVSEIIYVEADNKQIGIRTINDFFTTRETMESISKKLSMAQFYSPHRSYIINFDYVKSFNNRHIIMENDEKIQISRLRKKEFEQMFHAYIRKRIHA